MPSAMLDQVRELAMSLTPEDRIVLIRDVAVSLQGGYSPPRSMRGALADLGPGPSAEEIDEARSEVWANFPRDDF